MDPTRDPVALAEQIAYGRIGFGLAFMAAPGRVARSFAGADASRPTFRFMGRVFGGRDVALGLWAVLSRGDDAAFRRAVAVGAACDAWDTVAALGTPAGVSRFAKPVIVGLGVGAVVVGALAVRELQA
jgi:hypothetical protein